MPYPWSAGDEVTASEINAQFADDLKAKKVTLTAGENIDASSTPQCAYLKASDGKVYKAKSDADESTYKWIGFIADSQNVLANASIIVTITGIVSGFTGLTINAPQFIDASTAGVITETRPSTRAKEVAVALSATTIKIQQHSTNIYTLSQGSGNISSTTSFTVTCGFRPKTVVGHYYIVGNTDGADGQGHFWANLVDLSQGCFGINGVVTSIRDGVVGFSSAGGSDEYNITIDNVTDTTFRVNFNKSSGSITSASYIKGVVTG